MRIIGGLDIHRRQITFDCLDVETGEVKTGQIWPVTRAELRQWLAKTFGGRTDVELAVEGCTGWRFVVDEMRRAGIEPHLAEPADTAAKRGKKRRAKTDKADALHLRELLRKKDLPESWIPPEHYQEVRVLARTYLSLMEQRRSWLQRIHAQLYHQGAPMIANPLTGEGRKALAAAELSAAGRQQVEIGLATIQWLDQQIGPLRAQLQSIGRRQAGARALMSVFGIGALIAVIIWAELGDCRRFRRADQVVRLAGLDVTVWSSDRRRAPGKLAREGSPVLRWALFEAGESASRKQSPHHEYYEAGRKRLGGKRPVLSVARKLARECYHILRELGDAACAPPEEPAQATRKWPKAAAMTSVQRRSQQQMSAARSYFAPCRHVLLQKAGRPGESEQPRLTSGLSPHQSSCAGNEHPVKAGRCHASTTLLIGHHREACMT